MRGPVCAACPYLVLLASSWIKQDYITSSLARTLLSEATFIYIYREVIFLCFTLFNGFIFSTYPLDQGLCTLLFIVPFNVRTADPI